MAKVKVSEWSATPGSNTDIDGINIAENCPPSGINDAIREMMSQIKDFQTGAAGDSFNGPVGSTTPADGAFTTLSASGAVTLSGGTANGIPYLNGSKVLTTGSALTFDGTNLAVGTTTYSSIGGSLATLSLGGTNPTVSGGIAYQVNGAVKAYHYVENNVFNHQAQSGVSQAFFVNGSEQMRLTSTGLGIGTSSPQGLLEARKDQVAATRIIANNQNASNGASTNFDYYFGTTRLGGLVHGFNGSGAYLNIDVWNGSTATTRATFDSSGNLGLGVTPSAWDTVTAFQIKNGSLYGFGTGETAYSHNAYYGSGAFRYITSSVAATQYQQINGVHKWYTAPSGTAGNAISFTQAMSLTASGDWLLGKTANDTTNSGTVIAKLSANVGAIRNVKTATGTYESLQNYHSGSYVGGITYSDTATALVTSSDYRLKNITGKLTNSGSYIDSLNPVEGTWKADGSLFVGLIAHEAQEVSRTQVATGEKDGEQMQGMSYCSPEMIANIIAELQSLRKRVAELEVK